VLGVGAGFIIAPDLTGHDILLFALALLTDFFAFYAFQTANAVMIFWITLALALFYTLLGPFQPALWRFASMKPPSAQPLESRSR
jgi:hypothetical protein